MRDRVILISALLLGALGLLLTTVGVPTPADADHRSSDNGGGTPGTSRNVELVGHEPLFNRGMNAAPALFDEEDVIYIGNRTDGSSTCGFGDPRRDEDGVDTCKHPNPGILVVDVSDPTDPSVVNEIGPPHAGLPSETTRELRVWPERKLLMSLNFRCNPIIHACDGGSVTPTYRFFDLSDPTDPQFLSEWVPRQADGTIRTPHEFYLWEDPSDADRALLWMSMPALSTNPDDAQMMIADISAVPDGDDPALVAQGNWNQLFPGSEDPDNFDRNLALHSMTPRPDGKETHLAYLSGHFLVLDTTEVVRDAEPGTVIDLNDNLLTPPENRPTWPNPNPAHSAVPFPGRPFSFVTDEVYGTFTRSNFGCPYGWVHNIQIGDPAEPEVIGEYRIAENSCPAPSQGDQERSSFGSHNPTLTRRLGLVTWHSGGFQAINIQNPAEPRQAGWFTPEPLAEVANEDPALSADGSEIVMWSFPIVDDGVIYAVDIRNGLYVLEYDGPHADDVRTLDFLEGNSNLGDALRLERSGRP